MRRSRATVLILYWAGLRLVPDMNITLNGARQQIAEDIDVAALLESLELTGKRLAVEVNEEVIPRSHHEQFRLSDGDRVEIVHAIGGG